MLDVAVAYNRYKFIGHEFLTWLWFTIDTAPSFFETLEASVTAFTIGNRIVVENSRNEASETITIKGDDAGLEEGLLALRKGAVVTEMNLACQSDGQEWTFTLKGESLSLSSLRVPETAPMETQDDLEGLFLEKTFLYERVIDIVNQSFNAFLNVRTSVEWKETIVPQMRTWINIP